MAYASLLTGLSVSRAEGSLTRGRGGHGLRIVDRVPQRLLAQDVLACVERRDGDLGCVSPGVQMSMTSMSGRSTSSSQPGTEDCHPRVAAARPAAAASRPQSATMSGNSGRSKTRPAVRQAWEWAAPMKA
jgi:hypothetical protein